MPRGILFLLVLTGLVVVAYVRAFGPDAPTRSLWITLAIIVLPITLASVLVSRPGVTKRERFVGGVLIVLLLTCAAAFLVIVWNSRVAEVAIS
jgi:hypothetical protein